MSERKPSDGQYTRAGEREGRRLYPGERAKHWAGAFMTLWPAWLLMFSMLGWTNKDKIMDYLPLAEADGQTEVETGSKPTAFQLQVKKFTEETRIELDSIKSNTTAIRGQLAKKDQQNYTELKRLVDAIDARVAVIEQEVQP